MPVNEFPTLLFRCGHKHESWLDPKKAKMRRCPVCEGYGKKRTEEENASV